MKTTTTPLTNRLAGLSICERIVKNHGGKIEVESQVNQGTIFRVLLPIHHAVHKPA